MVMTKEQILAVIDEQADCINECYRGTPYTVLVCLVGAIVYAGHLIPRLRGSVQVQVCLPISYVNNKQSELMLGDLPNITTKRLLIVDDILDSGKTMSAIASHYCLEGHEVKFATLLTTGKAPIVSYFPSHKVDCFVQGFGLDNNLWGRNLPDLHPVSL